MPDRQTYWKVVNAVTQYMATSNGRRPSIEEIGELAGIKSTSHVVYHLLAAVENGDLVAEGTKGQTRRYAVKATE